MRENLVLVTVRPYVCPPLYVCQCDQYHVTISQAQVRAHRGGNTPVDTLASSQHTSLILDINVMVNWQLSKQGIRWPVSHDQIAGSNWTLWRLPVFVKWIADQGLLVDWIVGSSQVRHSRGLIFRALSVARWGYTARYVSKISWQSILFVFRYSLENIFFLHFSLVSIQGLT